MQKPWRISPVVAASTKRHNNVASIVYRAICAEYNLEHSKDWWVEPEKVVRNGPSRLTSICFTIGLTSC